MVFSQSLHHVMNVTQGQFLNRAVDLNTDFLHDWLPEAKEGVSVA